MMNMKKIACMTMVLVLAASAVQAVVIEYSAGDGASEAFVTVDFGYDIYNFSYKWDGSAPVSGWDMLDSIDQAGALDVDATWYESFQSHLVNDFTYGDAAKFDGGTSWGYYGSTDGENWSSNPVGVDTKQLTDGDWDGWSWGALDENWNHMRAPGEAVPEPVSLMLLGLGGLLVRVKRN